MRYLTPETAPGASEGMMSAGGCTAREALLRALSPGGDLGTSLAPVANCGGEMTAGRGIIAALRAHATELEMGTSRVEAEP
jgi:hypothetical protein